MTLSHELSPTERPHGETETIVGRLFAEMLGVSGLPRTASFFELGLDSVAVTVACARLEESTGVRIRFSQLFQTPTVAQLAAWIDAARPEDEEPGAAAESADFRAAEMVAITPMQAETVPADIVVELSWWFDGEIDETALEQAATDIHRRHQALHARYLTGPELGLAELPSDPGKAEFHRLGRRDTDAAAAEAFWETLRRPLRLGEGKIWRCATVHSAESGRLLFGLAVHHAAFDGQSWDIMTAEFPLAYAARAAGTAPQWPGRVASLGEMAADFRHQLASADIDTQRRYWREELGGMPACDFPRKPDAPKVLDAGGARWSPAGPAEAHAFSVPGADLEAWEEYARQKGMPPSVGVAAAFVEAVVRSGGTRDFGVMVPIANRASEEIDRSITNRVGNILLRPNGPARSGADILARAQESYFKAMAARDVLVVPKELGELLSGEGSDGAIRLDRLASLTYNTVPMLNLGGVDGVLANGEDGESKCMFAVMMHVVPVPEGLSAAAIVRTDLYESGLAKRVSQTFLDIISDGPLKLARETAS